MRLGLVLIFLALLPPIFGAEIPFYIGTVTDHSASKGIYLGSLDSATGKLEPLRVAAEIKNPNFLALTPDGHFLYAATNTLHADAVTAFGRSRDGALAALNTLPSGGGETCHISVDQTGRDVFVANYNGGSIASFHAATDGSLERHTALISFTGSGPDPVRQKKSYAHSIYADPANKFVYACDLGSDHVWIFHLDAADGALTPGDPPSANVPPGSGPRHLAFDRTGNFVYVANEMGASVTTFSRDAATGALTAIETVSTLPAGTSAKGVTTAEIVLHPSGKWLYVSNRGCDTISVFAVGVAGRLQLIQSTSSVAKFPRSFAVDPSGHWLIAAGQKDNRIAVLKIDPTTGKLTATDESVAVGDPTCVLFAPEN